MWTIMSFTKYDQFYNVTTAGNWVEGDIATETSSYGVYRLRILQEPSCGIHQLPYKCVGPTISHGSHLLSCQAHLWRIQSREGSDDRVLHLCNNTSVVIGSQGIGIQRSIEI